jgi:hypothetical protein
VNPWKTAKGEVVEAILCEVLYRHFRHCAVITQIGDTALVDIE